MGLITTIFERVLIQSYKVARNTHMIWQKEKKRKQKNVKPFLAGKTYKNPNIQ